MCSITFVHSVCVCVRARARARDEANSISTSSVGGHVHVVMYVCARKTCASIAFITHMPAAQCAGPISVPRAAAVFAFLRRMRQAEQAYTPTHALRQHQLGVMCVSGQHTASIYLCWPV